MPAAECPLNGGDSRASPIECTHDIFRDPDDHVLPDRSQWSHDFAAGGTHGAIRGMKGIQTQRTHIYIYIYIMRLARDAALLTTTHLREFDYHIRSPTEFTTITYLS
jgi:hypothetical protein